MGGSDSKEKIPQLTPEQQAKMNQMYSNGGVGSYDHPESGFIMTHDTGVHAYEEVKYAAAAQKLGKAKNSNVTKSSNDAYILPDTICIEKSDQYSN